MAMFCVLETYFDVFFGFVPSITFQNIQFFTAWAVSRPEYFPRGAGKSSVCSIARGQKLAFFDDQILVNSFSDVFENTFKMIQWSNILYLISYNIWSLYNEYLRQYNTFFYCSYRSLQERRSACLKQTRTV